MIQLKNVNKSFSTVKALDDVSLEINGGEFFGLLGPNGAGKSTTMSILIGYLAADSGNIFINGEEVKTDELNFRKEIGFVPQSIALYDELSAEENLKIFGSLYGLPKPELEEAMNSYLNAVGLYDRRKEEVRNYSGGMKRRLNLITALLHKPKVLLCDEPTVGVDPQSRNAIFDFLEKLNADGLTIVYTTHYMEEAERLCNRVAIIDSGKIIALATPDELLQMLPTSEHIYITKNDATVSNVNVFKSYGEIIDNNDRYELRLNKESKLSSFFGALENANVNVQNVTIQKPTLEELFLNLTGKRLRD
ncbi:MAG: ABC transporter ATP-binding protein [Ignavibacteriae bacterium]|nr:ABC transporter ATP-binding protein [Ignavibacteriota bacterium]